MSSIPTSPTTQTANAVVPSTRLNSYKSNIDFLSNPPNCRVYRTSNLSLTNNVAAAIGFGAERWDTDTLHDTSTNTERITVRSGYTGLWTFGASVEFQGVNTTGYRQVTIRLNGTTVIGRGTASGLASDQTVNVPPTDYRMAAGDYVEVLAYQNSGGALNVQASANYSPEFWGRWVAL